MSRHTLLYVLVGICFIVAIAADVVAENLILSSVGWVAAGLLGLTVVKATTDKPL